MSIEAFLHIGVGKTGSTAIETALHAGAGALAGQGVFSPRATRMERGRHILLGAYARDGAAYDRLRPSIGAEEIDQADFRQELEEALDAELAALTGTKRLIFTDVGLCSIRTTEEITRLRGFLAARADRVRLVIYLRRQDEFAVSRFHQDLKAGAGKLDLLQARPFIDYAETLALWSGVFGREDMVVRLYEPSRFPDRDVVRDFLAGCGVDAAGLGLSGERVNASMTPEAEWLLLSLNRRLGKSKEIAVRRARKPFFARLAAEHPGAGLKPSRAEAEAFYARYAASNEAVRAAWFPERAQLFSGDFSAYGEASSADSIAPEAVARLAAQAAGWPEAGPAQLTGILHELSAL